MAEKNIVKRVMERMSAMSDMTVGSRSITYAAGKDTGLTSTRKGFSASRFMQQIPVQISPVARLPQPIQMAVDMSARFDDIQRKKNV